MRDYQEVGAFQATGNATVEQRLGGWALALLLEEGAQRMVLPLGRRGRGAATAVTPGKCFPAVNDR
jgi:hypothetical protein